MDFRAATTASVSDLLASFHATAQGLSLAQVKLNRQAYGSNLISARETHWWQILISQLKSPFVYLLTGAATVSFLLKEPIDALLIILFVVLNALLGFWQENQAFVSLNKLKTYVTRTTSVRRDGLVEDIDDLDLVAGDVILLRAGDEIPADIRFILGVDLSVDESVLTGESAPVPKTDKTKPKPAKDIYEAANIGFSGTLLTTGKAEAVVIGVGNETELGRLSKLAIETQTKTPFSEQIASLSRAIIWLVAGTLVAVLMLHLIFKGGLSKFGELAIFAAALAVSVVPEALPLVITLSLSQGAIRLAKKKVVPKRLSAIEDLGSIEVLCTDKTGTITENRLTVVDYFTCDKVELLRKALWAATIPEKNRAPGEAFDRAIWEQVPLQEQNRARLQNKIADLPFDPQRRRNLVLLRFNEGDSLVSRGAVEAVLPLCRNLTKTKLCQINQWVHYQGGLGRRVLMVADKKLESKPLKLEDEENDLNFVGILAFEDPLKPSSKLAMQEAKKIGLTIKILTGDSPDVAASVGRMIGLVDADHPVLVGSEFDRLTKREKEQVIGSTHVFARLTPEQKFEIIRLLQKKFTVGYLGEGFNDAPALKAAHVAMVVNNATDIAKSTADIVLLSRSLKTIVDGIKEGRKTFHNSIKYIRATLISNFGNFFAITSASLFIPFLPMLPAQILLVNLLSDFPMISLATDAVDPELLARPRSYRIRSIIVLAIILGLISTIFDFTTFVYFVRLGEIPLQTMWFMESILTELLLIFSIRKRGFFLKGTRPGDWLVGLTLIAAAITLGLPFTRFGQEVFRFQRPTPGFIGVLALLAGGYLLTTESVKLAYYTILAKRGKGEV